MQQYTQHVQIIDVNLISHIDGIAHPCYGVPMTHSIDIFVIGYLYILKKTHYCVVSFMNAIIYVF